jgi:hypothetical protein
MINSKEILYPKGENDECYTPKYGVTPIIKYLPENKVIWCPFDTRNSEFVLNLRENGFDVVYSHIAAGQDFYTFEPEKWDIIVSNPPFTNKRKVFERALGFNKPFALLMSSTWLNDAAPAQIFIQANKDLQLLLFDRRIKFYTKKSITFSSAYYCCDLLPKGI